MADSKTLFGTPLERPTLTVITWDGKGEPPAGFGWRLSDAARAELAALDIDRVLAPFRARDLIVD